MSEIIRAILLGIIEGVTEFLPISSTGHLRLAGDWGLHLGDKAFFDSFTIFIQIGAILAVVVYFRQRIMDLLLGRSAAVRGARGMTPLEVSQSARLHHASSAVVAGPGARPMLRADVAAADAALTPSQRRHALTMIAVATVPVLVIGFLVSKIAAVEAMQNSATAIGLALVIGGVLMIVIEMLPTNVSTKAIDQITLPQALAIGFAQVLAAVFPGTSRSAATIMGGLAAGLSRPAATEFSFFLAIPAMGAACAYKLLKWVQAGHATLDDFLLLGIGTVVSFLVAWVVIAGFMGYVRKHSFVPFALYRIVLAGFVFLTVWVK